MPVILGESMEEKKNKEGIPAIFLLFVAVFFFFINCKALIECWIQVNHNKHFDNRHKLMAKMVDLLMVKMKICVVQLSCFHMALVCHFQDLINQMLIVDDGGRFSALQVLNHSWIKVL